MPKVHKLHLNINACTVYYFQITDACNVDFSCKWSEAVFIIRLFNICPILHSEEQFTLHTSIYLYTPEANVSLPHLFGKNSARRKKPLSPAI